MALASILQSSPQESGRAHPCPSLSPQGLALAKGSGWGSQGDTRNGCGITWQGRSRQVGQWEMPCAVRLKSWKMISSSWMRSSRTQPVGKRVGRVSPWLGLAAGEPAHALQDQPRLTDKAAAQACLGDGCIVRVAAQVQLLIQVQALELALERQRRQDWQADLGQARLRAGVNAGGLSSPGRCR